MRLPFFKQRTLYTCGPTSLEMAMAFIGRHTTQRRLAHEAHTQKKRGTTHQGMIEAALKEKLFVYVHADAELEDIHYFLSKKYPVIVDFTEPSSEEGHYAVVESVHEKHITLNDPWNGKNFKILKKIFLSRWHDELTHSRGWMMVISKDPFNMGRQYTPQM